MNGYRGFLRELSRAGSLRALGLQLRSGTRHALRRWFARPAQDPVALFFERYGADGVRPADPGRRALQLGAEACLACNLCSVECARVHGRPPLEPRDAVLSAARLEIDWVRHGIAPLAAGRCSACAACDLVCPVGVPIARIQDSLAALDTGPAADRRGLAGRARIG